MQELQELFALYILLTFLLDAKFPQVNYFTTNTKCQLLSTDVYEQQKSFAKARISSWIEV